MNGITKLLYHLKLKQIPFWTCAASHIFMRTSGFIIILHAPILKEERLFRKCKAQGAASKRM